MPQKGAKIQKEKVRGADLVWLITSRGVWSAWSLLPLSSAVPLLKAPASWAHSQRFARFETGITLRVQTAARS